MVGNTRLGYTRFLAAFTYILVCLPFQTAWSFQFNAYGNADLDQVSIIEKVADSDPSNAILQINELLKQQAVSSSEKIDLKIIKCRALISVSRLLESTETSRLVLNQKNLTPKQSALAKICLAKSLFLTGKFEDALTYAHQAKSLIFQINHIPSKSIILLEKGYIHAELGMLDSARAEYNAAQESIQLDKHNEHQWYLFNNLANLAYYQEEIDQAIRHYNQALDAIDQADYEKLSIIHYNLAGVFTEKKEYESAIFHLNSSIGFATRVGDTLGAAMAQRKMSNIYLEQNNLIEARHFIQESLTLLQQIDAPIQLGRSLVQLAKIQIKTGENKQALKTLSALKESSESLANHRLKLDWLDSIAQAHRNLGNFETSQQYLDQYIQAYKTRFNEEKNNQVKRLEIQFKTAKIDQEKKHLQSQLAIQISNFEQQKTINTLAMVVAALLLLVIFLVSRLYFKQVQSAKKFEKLSVLEETTQLYNKRYMVEALNHIIDEIHQEVHKDSRPASLIVFDLDHFKEFNDRFGGIKGDEALLQITKDIKNLIKKKDLFAKFKGGEFSILVDGNHGLELAHSIKTMIENLRISDTDLWSFSVSVGICHLDQILGDGLDALKACNLAVYQSKEAGRNRVTLYEEE